VYEHFGEVSNAEFGVFGGCLYTFNGNGRSGCSIADAVYVPV